MLEGRLCIRAFLVWNVIRCWWSGSHDGRNKTFVWVRGYYHIQSRESLHFLQICMRLDTHCDAECTMYITMHALFLCHPIGRFLTIGWAFLAWMKPWDDPPRKLAWNTVEPSNNGHYGDKLLCPLFGGVLNLYRGSQYFAASSTAKYIGTQFKHNYYSRVWI